MSAQTLYFCEGVDSNGYPINDSDTLVISSDGGYFYFLVRLPNEIGCSIVEYDIYMVNDYGEEIYSTTITQTDVGTDWNWFYKQVSFYEEGYYTVYVYDCYDEEIAYAEVYIHY